MHEYPGELQGKPFEGVAIYGFDLATNKFQSAWVDSFHMSTAIMFSEGDAGEKFSLWALISPGPKRRVGAGERRSILSTTTI